MLLQLCRYGQIRDVVVSQMVPHANFSFVTPKPASIKAATHEVTDMDVAAVVKATKKLVRQHRVKLEKEQHS